MTVPKLRFKEFDANWSLSSLGKMTTYFKGYAFKSESYKDSGIRVIRVSDLGRELIKTDNNSIYIDANEASAYENWIIKKDDIIITTVGSKPHLVDSAVGRPIYVKNNNEGLLNQNLLVLRPLDETVDSYFIYAQLLDKKYLTHIELIQRGNANQSNITVKDLQDFETYLTSKEEQTKIDSFLSAVDEKISQLTQKHELLSQYKQGMMQKLFSQQIRFKADDGSQFGEWEEVELARVSDVRDGTHDSPTYHQTGFPLITSKNLKNGKLDLTDINYISDKDFQSINKRSKVDVGDIIFGMIGTIGNPVLLESDGFAIKNVALIKEKGELLNIYLIQYLSTSLFFKQVNLLNAGNTQKFLALGQIRSLKVLKPCLMEQTRIANFLSTLDQKIEVVAQQIEQAKQWKKGLLQQMFV